MNFDPEERNGYHITSEMKQLWNIEMELLKKLLAVCEKHHLRIWAEGGTLLGAVRHHGFIPWDDDIDVAMPREDYDKLQRVAIKEFSYPLFLQTGYNDVFYEGIAKLRMDNTTAILRKDIWQNFHQGIFIDIFPLDGMPMREEDLSSFIQKKKALKRMFRMYFESNFSFTNIAFSLNRISSILKIKIHGFHNCFAKYDQLVKSYSNGKYLKVSLISWEYNKRYERDKSWYSKTIYMPFEDISIPVPQGYDQILKTQYGDEYMTPLHCKNEHGGFLIVDCNKSYKYYLPKIRSQHKCDFWKDKVDSFYILFSRIKHSVLHIF